MKSEDVTFPYLTYERPAPHGAGGLKSPAVIDLAAEIEVPPRTGRVD